MYKYKSVDLLMPEKELLLKRKLERLKFVNEKQKCRLRN